MKLSKIIKTHGNFNGVCNFSIFMVLYNISLTRYCCACVKLEACSMKPQAVCQPSYGSICTLWPGFSDRT